MNRFEISGLSGLSSTEMQAVNGGSADQFWTNVGRAIGNAAEAVVEFVDCATEGFKAATAS